MRGHCSSVGGGDLEWSDDKVEVLYYKSSNEYNVAVSLTIPGELLAGWAAVPCDLPGRELAVPARPG